MISNKISLIAILLLLMITSLFSSDKNYIRISEEYKTYWSDNDNIDSPTFWQSSDKKTNLLIATSKSNHNLFVYNAENGKFLYTIGKEGNEALEFSRPNGIWEIDDMIFVCERDNHRIQVLKMPDFKHIGFIGTNELIRPYGLTIFKANDSYHLYVTDQYEGENESYLPLNQLNKRVKHFTFKVSDYRVESKLVKSFGDISGSGILFIVESIYADHQNNNIIIAEEDKNQNVHKVYDLNGNFKNIIIGEEQFEYQAEGIALYDCGNGEGFWFCMDQDYYLTKHNTIHIYDRKTLNYITSFYTGKTDNTDGIWLTQEPFGNFKKGALFAVDDDGGVGTFDLEKIISTLNLNCK